MGACVAKALVLTEKPSVARDIAAALGGFTELDGFWESDDYVVTFAVGHLFELLEPEEVDEKYKRWTLDILPIIPERFSLKKKKGQSDRIRTIQKLAARDDVDRIVNACDAGREGELIFREVVQFLGIEKPIERLWLQSMTTDSIRSGFESLIPGSEMEGLARAAECRARSDWLIGMNATRALTKRLKTRKERTAWSAGRVQTPTLALLVARELEVLAHTPRAFWRVTAQLQHGDATYEGAWFDPAFRADDDEDRKDDRIFDEERAQAVVAAVSGQAGAARETRKPSRESAPPLFDLTSLQREGNRRFGWSARRTLGAAQRLYERHKLLTYPRTDSRCLPNDYRATVDEVLRNYQGASEGLAAPFAPHAARLLDAGLQNTERIFDDAGVSDHFAIVPTGKLPEGDDLSGDDKRLYDLVLRRFLGAFHPHALWERVERVTEVGGESFRTRARTLREPGWRAVLPGGDDDETETLPPLVPGQDEVDGVAVKANEAVSEREETKPPPRVSEARLLSLMENAGKSVEDDAFAAALQDKGLGTPATRADIIENLIAKGYALRQGKSLRPTVKGIRLIDTLQRIQIDRLASAQLTGELEHQLGEVEKGERQAEAFMAEIENYAREVVERAKTFEYEELYELDEDLGPCPRCGRPVREYAWFYRCDPVPDVEPDDDCPLRFWKDTSGRYIDRRSVRAIIDAKGKPVLLDGFTARNGRTYKGEIEIDIDEWKLKVRSAGWNEDGSGELPEYDVNDQPLGACPFGDVSEPCQVGETPTHFACATWVRAEKETAAWREARRLAREGKGPSPTKPEKPPHPGWVLPRTVCKREITRDEAEVYLREGKTELLTDFTSRFGRPFSATLVLKDTGRHGFEFPPRTKKSDGDDSGEKPTTKKTRKKTGAKTTRKKTTKKKTTTRKKTAARKSGTRKKAATKKTTRKKTAKATKSRETKGEDGTTSTRRGKGAETD